ncbi:hypothetical protein T07_6632 [Trichinella nelsoni]|uniref:Uncharacterized protein n=1 Tax=Trichinella nelsoni TaxID=6336 RepID=A0A0V0SDF9_9BILA|nr:hypothetical protein T07_6632 [Trichinella nelsoni]
MEEKKRLFLILACILPTSDSCISMVKMSMDNVERKEYDDSVNLKNFKFYYQVKMKNILSQPSSYPSTGRFNRLDARREPICGSEDKWQQWTAN